MKLAHYTIEASLRSLQPITHFKIHRWPGGTRYLVWWKLSIHYGRTLSCEDCGIETGLDTLCQDCYDRNFCECGQPLEDAYGSPGDGFCVRCR